MPASEPTGPSDPTGKPRKLVPEYGAPAQLLREIEAEVADFDPLAGVQSKTSVYANQSEYQKRQYRRWAEVAAPGADLPVAERQRLVDEERVAQEAKVAQQTQKQRETPSEAAGDKTPPRAGKRRRWDVPPGGTAALESKSEPQNCDMGYKEYEPHTKPQITQLDTEPAPKKRLRSRWDQTEPQSATVSTTPPRRSRRSKWDQPPPSDSAAPPSAPSAPHSTSAAPSAPPVPLPSPYFLSDATLNALLPSEGYEILTPPPGYISAASVAHQLAEIHAATQPAGYAIPEAAPAAAVPLPPPETLGELQFFKDTDRKHFSKLLDATADSELPAAEQKERRVLRLILRVKNGTPAVRKAALRSLTDSARSFGPQLLFAHLLPLLMDPSLSEQERHLLVKLIGRILYKLDDLVRPYTHKLLVVLGPLLLDKDRHARAEGKDIIASVAKAAGLPHMVATLRPDIAHPDEFVRHTAARALAIVAATLGVPPLLPFLRAVCRSRRSWEARHTGARTVAQIAAELGCAVLPHLTGLVDCVAPSLSDEQPKVRPAAALAIAGLAAAACPYGIESFAEVLPPLWAGVRKHRGKPLAAFLRASGNLVPLMDSAQAGSYAGELLAVLVREFAATDDELRRVVLAALPACASAPGVAPSRLRTEVLPAFFRHFWTRRTAGDVAVSVAVTEATAELAARAGVAEVLERLVPLLRDESESLRRMALAAAEKIVAALGTADVSERLEERLVDCLLALLAAQTGYSAELVSGFGTIYRALGRRTEKHLPETVRVLLRGFDHKDPGVRELCADLVAQVAPLLQECGAEPLLVQLGIVLYEYLGEEYPNALGANLGALRRVVAAVGPRSMKPPVRDVLQRITPILNNRHEKVQENAVDLIGQIAVKAPEQVAAREWMRICFRLLDLLKSPRKAIRRAANRTFGFIAAAIGPQDVLAALLTNLRVQERQLRVCTAVAIGIVAETCQPFTVLPALMNEYRTPEANVQNGVLKALSFMFEYIGPMARDYVYAVVPLLEDALTDRDQVHRQTAATVVKHMALGCVGQGVEDAFVHLLNLLVPNLYETSPHVIDRIIDGINGVRNAVGAGVLLPYMIVGLFMSARKVRVPYWRLYNESYVQMADAMVAFYPEVGEEVKAGEKVGEKVGEGLREGEEGLVYRREVLDVWI